jgi:hypothetical protein
MLWHKGWLETRYRLFFLLGFVSLFMTLQHKAGATSQGVIGMLLFAVPVLVVMTCAALAGAGVATQSSFGRSKGLHGSTQFTLSMPVSRARLMLVRAAVGWLEGACVIVLLCCALWFAAPALRGMVGPEAMLQYAITLIACSSGIYSLSVLLGTFLDDQWRTWGTILAAGAAAWISAHASLPGYLDIFAGMGKGSPLMARTMPWSAIVSSMLLATITLFAALRVLRAREY